MLLITGSVLLWQQLRKAFPDKDAESALVYSIESSAVTAPDLKGAYQAESAKNLTFQESGKDLFDLLLVNYKDQINAQRNVLLFPKKEQPSQMLPNPTGQRQAIWEEAATAIAAKAPKDALFLSWWDDSQRIHFWSGRDVFPTHPGAATFNSPLWKNLKPELIPASGQEEQSLRKMARWLTLDSEKALAEIKAEFGDARLLYFAVNNDLLTRLAEMADYGGIRLNLHSRSVPASDNLHGDISRIKRMAQEEGDGNYLVQKEGASYRVWLMPKGAQAEKNALLIRLLPFVESLKKLPDHVQMVYQSHWGGYFSIYRLNFK